MKVTDGEMCNVTMCPGKQSLVWNERSTDLRKGWKREHGGRWRELNEGKNGDTHLFSKQRFCCHAKGKHSLDCLASF